MLLFYLFIYFYPDRVEALVGFFDTFLMCCFNECFFFGGGEGGGNWEEMLRSE